jgi:hypothetical protein
VRRFDLTGASRRDPAVDRWLRSRPGPLGAVARYWFAAMRACGEDVREVMHDKCPVACIGDSAFCYINVFRNHVNVGFYGGAELADPDGLLEGSGKFMRHVKLQVDAPIDNAALDRLIAAAYRDMKRFLAGESQ